MEILVIGWAIIAVFTAAIARSKGRDFLGWLILGALFSVLAMFAVAAMPARVRASTSDVLVRHRSEGSLPYKPIAGILIVAAIVALILAT